MKLWVSASHPIPLLSLGLCLAVAQSSPLPGGGSPSESVCSSKECVQVANAILRDMNPKADPCTDFYEFACGGYIQRTEIPKGKSQIGSFSAVRLRNTDLIHSILTSPTEKLLEFDGPTQEIDAARRNIAKMQSLFGSCMDEDRLLQIGRAPLYDQVKRLLDIFPANNSYLLPAYVTKPAEQGTPQEKEGSDKRSENVDGDTSPIDIQQSSQNNPAEFDRATLTAALAFLENLGISTFLEVSIGVDPVDPTIYGVIISESGLGLPSKQYYEDKKIMTAYRQLIQDMFSTIVAPGPVNSGGGSETVENVPVAATAVTIDASRIAQTIIDFELQLAAIATEVQDLRNAKLRNNRMTLDELSQLNGAVDWQGLLQQILGSDIMRDKDVTVTSLPYQTKLAQVLAQTDVSTLQNYFVWNMIQELGKHLSANLRRPLEEFDALMKGIPLDQIPERWETCVDVVSSMLSSIVGHYYVAEDFPGSSKNQSEAIVWALRERYVEGMPGLDWLDSPTREKAVQKLNAMMQKVGYSTASPNVASPQSLEDHYAGLEMDSTDYFGNHLRARVWGTNRTNVRACRPVDREEWHMSPQTVNAYYNRGVNEIVFPAGILQPPFFSHSYPEYLNFGGIGAVAGHELTHGFDNNGRLYDANGAFANWWTSETQALFEQRAKCFVEQYSNFTVPNLEGGEEHVNGELTLGENLADNGGLKKAYEAWQRRFASAGTTVNEQQQGDQLQVNNQLLAGLEAYTREQLFFVSYARLWCSKSVPQYELKKVRTDPHSPNRWRVVGAVQNSRQFAEAFQCREGAPMNPKNKCEIW
ncbi:hypothetical protein BGW41_004723 [Actinomortierella wolfii]|nr:hypothetical protein BGW41_004723 [Actinomortierella wolfii]